MSLKLTSRAFQNEGVIPDKYSRQGGNISPPLVWKGVPDGTRSLVLIVDDPDAPSGLFVHWLVYGMRPETTELDEGAAGASEFPGGARQGINGFGQLGYGGPQPPSGMHRYFFRLYALDTDSDVPAGLNRQELDGLIEGHILEQAQLMGRYQSGRKTHAA